MRAMSFINYYSCTRIVWLCWCEASYINSIAYQSDLFSSCWWIHG